MSRRILKYAETVKMTRCPTCGHHVTDNFAWGEDGCLYRNNGRVRLSPRELGIIKKLAREAGRVVSRSAILDDVWTNDDVGIRTVDVHVRRLRFNLGDKGREMVETVRGVGYQWHGPKLARREIHA